MWQREQALAQLKATEDPEYSLETSQHEAAVLPSLFFGPLEMTVTGQQPVVQPICVDPAQQMSTYLTPSFTLQLHLPNKLQTPLGPVDAGTLTTKQTNSGRGG